jgi:hypothetical protein
MHLRATQQWAMSERDKNVYDTQLEVGETSGDIKRDDLVYYLAIQPRYQ